MEYVTERCCDCLSRSRLTTIQSRLLSVSRLIPARHSDERIKVPPRIATFRGRVQALRSSPDEESSLVSVHCHVSWFH